MTRYISHKTTRRLVETTRQFSTIFAVVLCKYLFNLIHLFLWTDTYVKTIKSSTAVVYPLFLMQESRDVFAVFIEIIFSHGDVFDSNSKLFW